MNSRMQIKQEDHSYFPRRTRVFDDVHDFPKVFRGWSWEENKLFELALAVVDEQDPQRWEIVASMVGGKKSAEEVQKHYVILLEDLQFIESGKLDHKIGGVQPCVQVDSTRSQD